MSQDHDYIAQLKERIVSLEQRIRTIAVSQSPQPIDALAFFAAHAPDVPCWFTPPESDNPYRNEVEAAHNDKELPFHVHRLNMINAQARFDNYAKTKAEAAWRWQYAQTMLASRPTAPQPHK